MESETSAARDVHLVWPKDSEPFRNKFNDIAGKTKVKYQIFSPYILAGTDALSLILALAIGRYVYWLFFQDPPVPQFSMDFEQAWSKHSWLFYGLVPVTLSWFWKAGHYSKRQPYWDELRETLKIILTVGMIDAALVFLAKWPVSRLWLGLTWMFALVLVPVSRIMVKRILLAIGGWRRPTVIAGIGENARRAAEAMLSERLMGYDVIAFVAGPSYPANSANSITIGSHDIPVFYYSSRLWEMLENLGSPHLVVALETGEEEQQHALLRKIGKKYKSIHIAPPVIGLPLYGTEVNHFFRHEVLLLNIRNNLGRFWAKSIKRLFDIFASFVGLVLLSPLLLIVGGVIMLDGGNVLFGHERIGRNGKKFKCLKFRTMVKNANEVLEKLLSENETARKEWNEGYKLKQDPRITPIGRFLRKTSLDELPQLWNVLKGEMSLVGPRPIIASEITKYHTDADLYLSARPGITGLWQISGRSDSDYASRVALDSWYVRNWSLWYDIYILLRTVVVVLKRDGAY
jgi:Undecaprenyl-phosphate galactose phosphotransferase WbaP